MKNFLNLPTELLRSSLLSFLCIRDVVDLDSAVVCSQERACLHEAMKQSTMCRGYFSIGKTELKWLSERQINLLGVMLCGDVSDADVEASVACLKHITSAKLDCCQHIIGGAIVSILESATDIRELVISNCCQITCANVRLARGGALTELRFIDCPMLSDDVFTELVVNCPNLETIDIRGSRKLTNISVRTLALICTKLRAFMFGQNEEITVEAVAYVCSYCPALRTIIGKYSKFASQANAALPQHYDILVRLARQCSLLEHVDLKCNYVDANQLLEFAQHCPNLHTFNIGAWHVINPATWRLFFACCPQLTHLNLDAADMFDVEILRCIATHCTALQSLQFAPGIDMDPRLHTVISDILMSNPALQCVNLCGVSCGIEALSINPVCCLNLTNLDISDQLEDIYDEESPARIFLHAPKLLHLNLAGNHVTATTLLAIGKHCTQLQTLNLNHCTNLDARALMVLAANCPPLKSLKLSSCLATEIGLVTLLSKCPLLEILDLTYCSRLSDASLLTIAACCKHLRTLKLAAANNLTAPSFQVLANACHQLRKVSLRMCAFITDAHVIALAENNKQLEDFIVTGSPHVTIAALQSLVVSCPRLYNVGFEQCAQMKLDSKNTNWDALIAPCKGQLSLRIAK